MPATRATQNARKPRHCEYLGRHILISGECFRCLVWIDGRMAFGPERRFTSIRRAMEVARNFIRRHSLTT